MQDFVHDFLFGGGWEKAFFGFAEAENAVGGNAQVAHFGELQVLPLLGPPFAEGLREMVTKVIGAVVLVKFLAGPIAAHVPVANHQYLRRPPPNVDQGNDQRKQQLVARQLQLVHEAAQFGPKLRKHLFQQHGKRHLNRLPKIQVVHFVRDFPQQLGRHRRRKETIRPRRAAIHYRQQLHIHRERGGDQAVFAVGGVEGAYLEVGVLVHFLV